jgi:hypothetical protein
MSAVEDERQAARAEAEALANALEALHAEFGGHAWHVRNAGSVLGKRDAVADAWEPDGRRTDDRADV